MNFQQYYFKDLTTMEELTKQTVAFSGYRTSKITATNLDPMILFKIKDSVRKCIINLHERGFRRFITGGSSGFDLIVGKALLELRATTLSDIKIIVAIPHHNQYRDYTLNEQSLYLRLIDNADEVNYISKEYHDTAYLDRNNYMLTHSSLLVCYYDGQRGGTMYTVNRALRLGYEIINLCEGYNITRSNSRQATLF
ncbi:MAG: SLOG family protein [Rikenellaceae bacterium]